MSTFRLSLDYLPNDTLNDMTGLEQRVCRALFSLLQIRKEVIAIEYARVTPTLNWIAGQCDSTTSVISRIISRLKSKSIIDVTYTRKRNGTFHINRYGIGEKVKEVFKRFIDKKKGNKVHRLTLQSTVLNKEPLEDNYFDKFVHFMCELTGKERFNVSKLKQEQT